MRGRKSGTAAVPDEQSKRQHASRAALGCVQGRTASQPPDQARMTDAFIRRLWQGGGEMASQNSPRQKSRFRDAAARFGFMPSHQCPPDLPFMKRRSAPHFTHDPQHGLVGRPNGIPLVPGKEATEQFACDKTAIAPRGKQRVPSQQRLLQTLALSVLWRLRESRGFCAKRLVWQQPAFIYLDQNNVLAIAFQNASGPVSARPIPRVPFG